MIPDPWGLLSGAAGSVAGWSWDQVANGIARWVLGSIAELVDGVLNFLKTSARPDVTDAWFAGSGSPYASVRNVSAVLLVGFLLAGIIQGLFAGDIGGMLRRVAVDAPVAVLGMVATTVIVDLLLDLTDAMSTAVLGGSDGQAVRFLEGFGVEAHLLSGGFSTVVIGLVAVIAAVMVWIELMVRSSLMYLLVALSPLAFAASVWPAAKGVLRRLIEVMLAVIVSKFVISVALAVGVTALGGAGSAAGSSPGIGEWASQGLGSLVVGTSVLCLAAFSPFMVLRLMPLAESAMVAQGISRAPMNTARSGMNTAYYTRSLGRLSGGHGGGGACGGSGGAASPPPDASAPPFGPPSEIAAGSTASGSMVDGGSAGAVGAKGGSAPGAGGASGGTAGTAGGSAAAGAAAGPAVVAVAAVEGAKKAKDVGQAAYQRMASSAGQAAEGEHSAGWKRIPNEPTGPDPNEPMPREGR